MLSFSAKNFIFLSLVGSSIFLLGSLPYTDNNLIDLKAATKPINHQKLSNDDELLEVLKTMDYFADNYPYTIEQMQNYLNMEFDVKTSSSNSLRVNRPDYIGEWIN